MSIASQLTALEGNISDAYDMVAQRGGTVPARKNMENLDDAIATIPSGGGSSWQPADFYCDFSNGKLQKSSSTSYTLPSNVTDVGDYMFSDGGFFGYDGAYNLVSLNFDSLTTVSGNSAFFSFGGNMSNLTSISFANLTTVSGNNAFQNAFPYTMLTSVSFPSLTTITSHAAFRAAFSNSDIQTLSFPVLSNLGSSYTTQFSYMLSGCNDVTVHFPAALQSTIGSWADVTDGFGGTNTTVLFDL